MKNQKNNLTDGKLWPKELIIPMPKEFEHGSWIEEGPDLEYHYHEKEDEFIEALELLRGSHNVKRSDISDDVIDSLRYECTSKCCLVGFAALAFNEGSCNPHYMRNHATAEFLNKFIEFATGEPYCAPEYIKRANESDLLGLFIYASDIFEGCGGSVEMSGRRAHNLWKKTAAHFGYDVDNLHE